MSVWGFAKKLKQDYPRGGRVTGPVEDPNLAEHCYLELTKKIGKHYGGVIRVYLKKTKEDHRKDWFHVKAIIRAEKVFKLCSNPLELNESVEYFAKPLSVEVLSEGGEQEVLEKLGELEDELEEEFK